MASEHKILFTGTMGVGKTTCVGVLSEIEPVRTEAANSHPQECAKATTTVALDYGELTLDGDEKLHLVATPGQARFDFMWSILARGALGVILLVDNSRPDPIDDLRSYLGHFPDFVQQARVVIGVSRTQTHPQPSIEDYHDALAAMRLCLPVLSVDVRRRDDALLLVSVLLSELEFH